MSYTSSIATKKNDATTIPSDSSNSSSPPRLCSGTINRVRQNWELIRPYHHQIGIDFFIRLIHKFPQFLVFFTFEKDASDLHSNKAFIRHAKLAMETVDEIVKGLANIEELIPKLFLLTKMHSLVDVPPEDYAVMFDLFVDVIHDKSEDEQDWSLEIHESWKTAFSVVSAVFSQPIQQAETEHVEGWGVAIVLACVWLSIVTPFQIAGFVQSSCTWWAEPAVNVLNICAASVLFLDMIARRILENLAIGGVQDQDCSSSSSSSGGWKVCTRRVLFRIKLYLNRYVWKIRLDRWQSWPKMDAMILLSFPLQHISYFLWTFYDKEHGSSSSSCHQIDNYVHWTAVFGLFRLAAVSRVIHLAGTAENSALMKYKIRSKSRMKLRVMKLITTLFYVTHITACVWCIVVQLEGKVENGVIAESPFVQGTSMGNAYLRSIHWAWVSLAGIGNTEWEPQTSLEILMTLLVHLTGATLYAVTTGHVLAVLQAHTEQDNQLANEIADLSEFMANCSVPTKSRDRIVTSYFMQQQEKTKKDQHIAAEGKDEFGAPKFTTKVMEKLPGHHRDELLVFSRAETIRSRSKCNLSFEFCFALAEALPSSVTLLAGDYLFQIGDKVKQRVILIEQGTLEVIVDGMCVETLNKGDFIGRGWLSRTPADTRDMEASRKHSDFLSFDGHARASIRAMSTCRLASGLSLKMEANDFRRRFPNDIYRLHTNKQTKGMKILKNVVTANTVVRILGDSSRHVKANLENSVDSFAEQQDGETTEELQNQIARTELRNSRACLNLAEQERSALSVIKLKHFRKEATGTRHGASNHSTVGNSLANKGPSFSSHFTTRVDQFGNMSMGLNISDDSLEDLFLDDSEAKEGRPAPRIRTPLGSNHESLEQFDMREHEDEMLEQSEDVSIHRFDPTSAEEGNDNCLDTGKSGEQKECQVSDEVGEKDFKASEHKRKSAHNATNQIGVNSGHNKIKNNEEQLLHHRNTNHSASYFPGILRLNDRSNGKDSIMTDEDMSFAEESASTTISFFTDEAGDVLGENEMVDKIGSILIKKNKGGFRGDSSVDNATERTESCTVSYTSADISEYFHRDAEKSGNLDTSEEGIKGLCSRFGSDNTPTDDGDKRVDDISQQQGCEDIEETAASEDNWAVFEDQGVFSNLNECQVTHQHKLPPDEYSVAIGSCTATKAPGDKISGDPSRFSGQADDITVDNSDSNDDSVISENVLLEKDTKVAHQSRFIKDDRRTNSKRHLGTIDECTTITEQRKLIAEEYKIAPDQNWETGESIGLYFT